MIGKYVVVRGRDSGVFTGILKERNGGEVILNECRRIWYWDGASSISQLAVDGVKAPEDCKFTVTVEEILILDAIEIIPCTKTAEKSIKEVVEWKM